MKVTLVYPCLRNFGGWNSLGKHLESGFILHGVASLSACLKQQGYTVNLLDLRERTSWQDTRNWIRNNDAEAYGIYMSTLDYYEAKTVAEIVKREHPKAKTIVGGPHPSIVPETLVKDTMFDFIFVGEGEITFPKMLKDFDAYPRIVHGEHPDLNKLPYEDRAIFNLNKVFAVTHPTYPSPFINIISGRGCPYNCSFCKPSEDLIFGKFRMRSVDNLMGEIRLLLEKYPFVKFVLVDDDMFTISRKYIEEFVEQYRTVGKPFGIQSRADWVSMNYDLLKLMKSVGLIQVRMGIESFNQRILNLMRKGTTVEQNVKAIENCHKLGLQVVANYMLGNPTETKGEMLDTIRMIRKTSPEWRSAAFYTPIVGTDLYEYCKQHNLLMSDDPTVLGTRSINDQPKLRGINYDWIQTQMYGRFYRQRHFIRRVLNRYPTLFGPVRKVTKRVIRKMGD